MPVPRSLYLVVGVIAAPVGVCTSAIAPLAGMLAGAIAVGLMLLVTAACVLLTADWRTEVESRQAWVEVAPTSAQWNPTVGKAVGAVETQYLPAHADDALRDVF